MSFGFKNCLECGEKIEMKIRRDLHRKNYCSYSCRQIHKYKTDPRYMKKFMERRHLSCTPEANAKKGCSLEKNHKWISDRSKLKKRPAPESRAFKKSVLERDGHKCIWCGSYKNLIADHIKPYATYPDLRFIVSNGRTLCDSCHKKTDTYGCKTRKHLAPTRPNQESIHPL